MKSAGLQITCLPTAAVSTIQSRIGDLIQQKPARAVKQFIATLMEITDACLHEKFAIQTCVMNHSHTVTEHISKHSTQCKHFFS